MMDRRRTSRRKVILVAVIWSALLVIPITWALDRKPPFSVLPAQAETPTVRAGETLRMVLPIRRNLDKLCSATFTRHIIDAAGFRHDLGGVQFMSAESLHAMDIAGPLVKVAVPIPIEVSVGPAVLTSDREYECNPLHTFWPIRTSMTFNFTVVP
jgi:hypothetical protein